MCDKCSRSKNQRNVIRLLQGFNRNRAIGEKNVQRTSFRRTASAGGNLDPASTISVESIDLDFDLDIDVDPNLDVDPDFNLDSDSRTWIPAI